LAQRGPGS